jgi:hypothetical protein
MAYSQKFVTGGHSFPWFSVMLYVWWLSVRCDAFFLFHLAWSCLSWFRVNELAFLQNWSLCLLCVPLSTVTVVWTFVSEDQDFVSKRTMAMYLLFLPIQTSKRVCNQVNVSIPTEEVSQGHKFVHIHLQAPSWSGCVILLQAEPNKLINEQKMMLR